MIMRSTVKLSVFCSKTESDSPLFSFSHHETFLKNTKVNKSNQVKANYILHSKNNTKNNNDNHNHDHNLNNNTSNKQQTHSADSTA